MSFKLETDRLILKIEDDTAAQQVLDFYVRNQEQFEHFEPTRPKNFYTLAYQMAALTYEYHEIIKGNTLRYYVYTKEQPDILIGSVNFSNFMHHPFSRTSIGYKFDKEAQGHGYAYEACQAAIPVIFSNYRIHRIEARVAPDNLPSIRLLERLHFLYEGIEYQGVEIQGVYKDHYRYGLISTIQ